MRAITLSDGEGGTATIPVHWAEVRYWLDRERAHVVQPGYPIGFVGYEVWDAEAGTVARVQFIGCSATECECKGRGIEAMVDALRAGGGRRARALAAGR